MKTKKYISLLMAIIMMLSLFAGCGSEGNTPSVSDDKDTLYLRLSSALQSTDWQQTSAMEGNKITYVQLFEGLYGIDESAGGYYNLLAKDIQVSEDGLTYTIELVDATFQNGDPLTAEDVVFSYELAMQNSKFGYVTSMIDSIKADGDKTVIMTLTPFLPLKFTARENIRKSLIAGFPLGPGRIQRERDLITYLSMMFPPA